MEYWRIDFGYKREGGIVFVKEQALESFHYSSTPVLIFKPPAFPKGDGFSPIPQICPSSAKKSLTSFREMLTC